MVNDRFGCLDVPADQFGLAILVGVERQAIGDMFRRRLLLSGWTYRECLLAICKRQREMAAGRGGEQQFAVAQAKARESKLKGDLLEFQLAEKGGMVLLADEQEKMVGSMIVAARTELLAMSGKLREQIKREHGVDVPRALIDGYIHSSLEHLATLGDQAASELLASDESALDAAAEGVNHAVGEPLSDPVA